MDLRLYCIIIVTIVLGLYLAFNFTFNPYFLISPNLSFETTDHNSSDVFSSLSRNFEKTVDKINNDENSTE